MCKNNKINKTSIQIKIEIGIIQCIDQGQNQIQNIIKKRIKKLYRKNWAGPLVMKIKTKQIVYRIRST